MKRVAFWTVAVLVLVGLQTQLAGWIGAYYYKIVILTGINIILAVSLNLINGITGQFSIGHAGFYAIGAYTSASLVTYGESSIRGMVSFLPRLGQDTVLLLAGNCGCGDCGGDCRPRGGHSFAAPAWRLSGDRDAGFRRNHPCCHSQHRRDWRGAWLFEHSGLSDFFFLGLSVCPRDGVGDPQPGEFQLWPGVHLDSR